MNRIATTASQPSRSTVARIGRYVAVLTLAVLASISLWGAITPATSHPHRARPRPAAADPSSCRTRWHYEFVSSGHSVSMPTPTCNSNAPIENAV